MAKKTKKLVGLLCLSLVFIMTAIAFLLPATANAADGDITSVTETIRVTVYDQYPAVKITSPGTESTETSSSIEIKFDYENSEYVDFTLSYVDDDGAVQEVSLPRFIPDNLDPQFGYASGSGSFVLNLADYGLSYNNYILNATSVSAIGPGYDSIDFTYVPSDAKQTGSEEETNDPIISVRHDDGVARVVITVYDENGNPIFDEPIVINYDEPYEAGVSQITLPFSSYGIKTGKYYIGIESYKYEVDEHGEKELVKIKAPSVFFEVTYTQPDAPAVPDTGRFIKNLNVAKSDVIITSVIVFVGALIVAFSILGRKKKNYRANIRRK